MPAARVLALPMLAALLFSVPANAEDFRIQTQLSYDQVSPDGADVPDIDVFTLSGTYFLSPVPTDGVPVGEAAYIARSSYADVIASYAESGDADADALAANLGYHLPDTIFFGRVGVVSTDLPGGDDTSWNGTFGIVPIPRLFFGTDFSEGGYDPNVTARYAAKLANDHWYAASVNVIDVDDGDTDVGVELDYYFPSFKLGGGYNTGGDRWTVRAEFGLPQGFALLGRVYADDGGDGLGLTLTWRDL
jgi:hypothetical protein